MGIRWAEGESHLAEHEGGGTARERSHRGAHTAVPISDTDFDIMMSILGGASRVVFVNVNNAVLARGAETRYKNVVVADWATLVARRTRSGSGPTVPASPSTAPARTHWRCWWRLAGG